MNSGPLSRRGGASRVALLLAIAFLLLAASAPRSVRGSVLASKLDARVLEDTEDGKTATVLVLLEEQADLSGATALGSREARGRYVFEALRAAARRTQPEVTAELERLGVPFRPFWVVNAIEVDADREVLEALARLPAVRRVEANRAFRATLPVKREDTPGLKGPPGVEWGVERVRAPELWGQGYRGEGVVIANQDTGIQWEHPALIEQYRGWDGESASHDYNWWDAIHEDIGGGGNPCGFSVAEPCDDHGHGTHTTGIAVGGDGGSNQIGVAPGARWIGCRNMDQGVGRPTTYAECFQFFMAPTDSQGNNPDPSRAPHIVSNSWGCPPSEGCDITTLQLAVDNMRVAGIMVVVSAGNSGSACGSILWPPSFYDSATTVGSTDRNDVIASNSSRGPSTADGSMRIKPDLVAPGVGVRSSYPTDGYATLSGTSMAAPHVAGGVALLWSARPDLVGKIDATEDLLFQAAEPLTSNQGCGGLPPSAVPNNTYGWGRLDVSAALAERRLYLPLLSAATP